MYIWWKKIKDNQDWLVTFEDWTSQKFTLKSLTYLISEEPVDPSKLQDLTCRAIAKDIVSVLIEHDVVVKYMPYINSVVQRTIEDQQKKFICQATWQYSNIQKEIESFPEDERKQEELNQLDIYADHLRMSAYQNLPTNN